MAFNEARLKFDPNKGIFRQFANHIINNRALDQFRKSTKARLGRRPHNKLDYASYAHHQALVRRVDDPSRFAEQEDVYYILNRYKHKGRFFLTQRHAGKPITFFTGNSTAKTSSDRVLHQMQEDYAA